MVVIDDAILRSYAGRMTLARAELDEAHESVRQLTLAMAAAEAHLKRCTAAERGVGQELAEYAATGMRKIFCVQCDTLFRYEPVPGEATPMCPRCHGQADLATAWLDINKDRIAM